MKKMLLILVTVALAMAAAPVLADDFGSVTGTGSYIYVSTGYTPRYIEVRGASPAASAAMATWQYGMAASACFKTIMKDASGSLTSYVAIATPCLKTFAGNTTSAPGFMIGIDSQLFPSGSVLYWRTVR